MAKRTRMVLKEKFESVHRNFDWVKKHCADALELIKEHNPKLSEAIKSLADGVDTLDELAQNIYSKI